MALTTVDDILTAAGVVLSGDTVSDSPIIARYDLLRRQIEAAVKNYVKWGIEAVSGAVCYRDGKGFLDVYLPPWVSSVANVWLDSNGHYGQGTDPVPFADDPLTVGRDYVLVLDADNVNDTTPNAKGGLLRKTGWLSNPPFPSDLVRFRGRSGGLAWSPGPTWPIGAGNIKIEYTYGFSVIPEDIKLAVETAHAIVRNTTRYGWPVTSESLTDYSYSASINLNDREFVSPQSSSLIS